MKIQKLLNNWKIFITSKGTYSDVNNIGPMFWDAQIKIVDGCNSRCITCDIWKSKTKKEMSLKTYTKVLDELISCGLRRVGITGGEPLLHQHIVDICRVTKDRGVELIIATNGLLLSNKINTIAKYVDGLSISLDGLEKTNDEIRGIPGYYKNVTKSILNIRKKYPRIRITISTTLTGKNLNEIKNILEWCRKYDVKWSANLLMNSLYFFNKVKIDDLKINRSKESVDEFKKILLDYKKKLVVNISRVAIDYLVDFLIDKHKPAPCVLGLIFAFVDCDANYYSGCWALPSIGNLARESLTEIVMSKKFKNRIKNMYKLNCPGCTCGYDQNWEINNYGKHLLNRIVESIGV